ncbi:RNA pol II transcription cofactor [Recurvomyces mirabilis]|uniref:RNA pol II transcription cofactor n=1 Tax=Recurvomyces mirabilis TaxID=574656 RepID=A0AAE0TPB8_9PEZI|nr:RNA pol II transcription cofactor [Recurvomyces mirabilis]KAK5150028.1 RNA pol II transcription cofactor [Recurvomyces mirabilis]
MRSRNRYRSISSPYKKPNLNLMRLFLAIFVCITAIILAVYRQDELTEYMRLFLRTSNLKTAARSLHQNITANRTLSTMSPHSTFVGLPVIPPEDPSLNAVSPKPRGIQQVFLAREQGEGAGATVRRSIGTPKLKNFTPFLMLDHFSVAPGAGFPDHPHRGQETITYLLEGAVDHEDFAGNKGTINSGDLQFMTAGRGIVHAEMPHDDGMGSTNIGMQLWVDLPKDLKSCEPRYRDLRSEEIPVATADDGKVTIKVISGRSYGVDSVQELAYTPVWLLDVTVKQGGKFVQNLPAGWNSFAYILEGTVTWDTGATSQEVHQYHNTVFEQKGDQVIASVPGDAKEGTRFILVAGVPLTQPIVQYGPFVLTDPSQVRQAMMDYSSFTNGFERAENWRSEIGKVMMG